LWCYYSICSNLFSRQNEINPENIIDTYDEKEEIAVFNNKEFKHRAGLKI
jgi:hypothetical protein